MTEATTEMKPWQKGYDLDLLQEIAGIFRSHDKGLILGAFGAYKENAVAEALAAERLTYSMGWAIDGEELQRSRPIRDFAGQVRAKAEPGDFYIKRLAYLEGAEDEIAAELGEIVDQYPRCWALCWEEHPAKQILTRLGFRWTCSKIAASSEITGVYLRSEQIGDQLLTQDDVTPPRDRVGIARLDAGLDVKPLVEAVERLRLNYADHYSGYNVRHSWSALALRGYAPLDGDPDPDFIIKPSEMSKKWKAENPEKLDWVLMSTVLRAALPEAEPLIEAIPGTPHRIRLMRLAPGGGELERHADITDPDAGTEIGQLCRLHFPLVTNEACVFESWNLRGQKSTEVMRPGECWYLDVRKPHTARNNGDTERLHLVIDMEVNAELQDWLA